MTDGNVADVDQIEARVDVRGQAPVQEVDDDLSGGGRFGVALPDGGRRADHHDRQAACGEAVNFAFRQELASLVIAHHVPEDGVRPLVGSRAIRGRGQGSHRARVDDLADPESRRDGEQVARPVHVVAIELARIARVEPIVGSRVEHDLRAGHRATERSRVREIPLDAFDVEPRETAEIARRSNQAADPPTVADEGTHDVRADEARSPGHENGHVVTLKGEI